MPTLRVMDIIEIAIIAFLLYHILLWLRNSRAKSLLKGVLIIFIFCLIAAIMNMSTILWIIKNVASVAVIVLAILLQPELRAGMNELGEKNFFTSFFRIDSRTTAGRFSDKTITEIVQACVSMAKVHTGALIVVQQNTPLGEYQQTGIDIDGIVTSQLLINIFEKNTPLHDGAVLIEGDRVISATCYLPLSDNQIDKDLGTRHRAGLGVSEVTDALVIIVSEESGQISVAYKGSLHRYVTQETLREWLVRIQNKRPEEKKSFMDNFRKGREQNDKS